MRQKIKYICSHYPIAILLIVFILAELIIDPVGNFPLNDDWWYTKLLYHFQYNQPGFVSWCSSTEIAHVYAIMLFAKLFGSGFVMLRFYTICFSLLTTLMLYLFIDRVLQFSKKESLVLSLLFLLNPFFVSLSNSFMNEVPFLFFSVGGLCFYLTSVHKENKKYFLLSVCFLSIALLIRQTALSLFISIAIIQFLKTKKINIQFLTLVLLPFAILFLFEVWLVGKDPFTAYPLIFFNGSYSGHPLFIDYLIILSKRWVHYITISALCLFPILVPYFIYLIRSFQQHKTDILIGILVYIPVLISFRSFPIGNYLYNMGLGPNTLYDTYLSKLNIEQNQSAILISIAVALSAISSFALLFIIVRFIRSLHSKSNIISLPSYKLVLFVGIIMYYILTCRTTAIFDRYIFLIMPFLAILVFSEIKKELNFKSVVLPLILLGTFSVFATRDHHQLNSNKWNAISYAKNNLGAQDSQINGGYEHSQFNFSDSNKHYNKWFNQPAAEYLVAQGNVPKYTKINAFVYQRFIPFKKDTVFLLKLGQ